MASTSGWAQQAGLTDTFTALRRAVGDPHALEILDRAIDHGIWQGLSEMPEADLRRRLPLENPFGKLRQGQSWEQSEAWYAANRGAILDQLAVEETLISRERERFVEAYEQTPPDRYAQGGRQAPDPKTIVELARPDEAWLIERRAAVLASRLPGKTDNEIAWQQREVIAELDAAGPAADAEVLATALALSVHDRPSREQAQHGTVRSTADLAALFARDDGGGREQGGW